MLLLCALLAFLSVSVSAFSGLQKSALAAMDAQNARAFVRLAEQHGSFHGYLCSLDGLPYAERRKALASQFKHLGPTGIFVFLHTVDEPVPSWEERNA